MAGKLDGTKLVSITWTAPNENAAQALRDFFDFHKDYMKEKSYRQGQLELIQYTIAESPEYVEDGFVWMEGKTPERTGKIVFHQYELYRNADGIHHHWIDGKEIFPSISEMIKAYKIEFKMNNMLTITHSLWD